MTFTTNLGSVAFDFQADSGGLEFGKHYNIAPTQQAPVVVARDGKHRKVSLMTWGLVPHWAKEPSIGNHMINARAETLAGKPSFRMPYRQQRCIVPVSGFYEWQRQDGGKQPYYFHPPSEGRLLGLAGLWESWEDPEQRLETFTVITTTANRAMQPVHDRMPVIIRPEMYEQWLNCRDYSGEAVSHLLAPPADDLLTCHPVSRFVNNPEHDSRMCIEPI